MTLKTTFSFETRIKNRDFPLRVRRMVLQNATAMHCHEFTELVLVYDGKGLHTIGDNPPVELSRGNVFVVPKGVYHQYLQEGLGLLNILFETNLLPLPLLDVYAMPYFNMIFKGSAENHEIYKIADAELEETLSLAAKLEIELNDLRPGYQFTATALFMLIVMYLARATGGKSENSSPPHVHISRIIEYMHKHFNERISIEKLADNAGMSMSSLLRHFKRITGSSPKEYQARLRINYACELLDNTRLSMDEIAFNAGFHDGSHFSNELKKLTGVSPSKYRTDRQNKIHQT